MFDPVIPEARAFAPASVGNVAVGFDILGHALSGVGDFVVVRRCSVPGVRIAEISGLVTELPKSAKSNTASAAVLAMVERLGLGSSGFELTVEKGIPLSSGMGGSAASAVAAVAAVNHMLSDPLPIEELYEFALAGEAVASGGVAHGDNVAASLLGGLSLRSTEGPPVRLPVDPTLHCVLVHPKIEIRTEDARTILPTEFPLRTFIDQSTNLAGVLVGCQSGDKDLIARSLSDQMIEPCRRSLIPGFQDVKNAAMASGALGCSISGAGPSVFAWFVTTSPGDLDPSDFPPELQTAGGRMLAAFQQHGIDATIYSSPVNCPGVQIL
jgi:homoserine kinase